MAEERPPQGRPPTGDELREALAKIDVAHVLVETCTAVVSLGFQRLQPDTRDLGQARVAIEALRALEPVLREGGVAEELLRDLGQARANLQLAYASAVASSAAEPEESGDSTPPPSSSDGEPAGGSGGGAP